VVLSSVWKVRLNLDADFDLGVRIGGEGGVDLLRNLHEPHLGGGDVDGDVAVK